jgi:hypothetical protein
MVQSTQLAWPCNDWNVPASQATQVVWLDDGCEVPAGQSSHAVAPVLEL